MKIKFKGESLADSDLQIRARGRGGGGHPDPEKKGSDFGLKIRGSGPLPWIRHWVLGREGK